MPLSGGNALLTIVGLVLTATASATAWMGELRTRRGVYERARHPRMFWVNVVLLLALAALCFWRAVRQLG